jgi:trans-L-3-hydroxyproline dehydratase
MTSRPDITQIEATISEDRGRQATARASIDDAHAILVAIGSGGCPGGHELREVADVATQIAKGRLLLTHHGDGRPIGATRCGKPARSDRHGAALGYDGVTHAEGGRAARQEGDSESMTRTSAREAASTVVRTYAAGDRASAERSFRRERDQARRRGWEPVSQRWRSEGREHVLTVVYEVGPEAPVVAEELKHSRAAEVAHPQPVPWTVAQARARDDARVGVETLDLHCAGEPLRLIRSGYPDVPLLPINERRAWAREHADHIRRLLMFEPRGHRDMYGAVLLPPYREDADVAVLFMHNEGYSTMCGHGIIALTQGLIEEGLYPATSPTTTIRWETPAGLVTATAAIRIGRGGEPVVDGVRFVNVASYLHAERLLIRPRGVRLFGAAAERKGLSVQLAFGGAYYGIVDVAELGMRVVPDQLESLARAGAAISNTLRRDHSPTHPLDASLGFVYGTILVDSDPSTSPDGSASDASIRNVTVFADAEVDRSPCGSGTSALLAARHALGASQVGDVLVNASITGEVFVGRIESATTLGPHEAVITSIEGDGYVTGHQRFVVDERDPLGRGFLLR